jgi:hypothetical protein
MRLPLRSRPRISAFVLTCAAALLGIAGCSGNAGQDGSVGEHTVFQDAPTGNYFTYTVSVAEPTDIILVFSNMTNEPVHLQSISVPGASKAMQLIGTNVYDARKLGFTPATALGILPEECPGIYVPAAVDSLTVPPHTGSPWFAAVAIRFDKPGIYWLHRFRIDYSNPQGRGWDDLSDTVRLTVREPARPGPKPERPIQCTGGL